MVQLHAIEHGVSDVRSIVDIDVLGQARPRGALEAIHAAPERWPEAVVDPRSSSCRWRAPAPLRMAGLRRRVRGVGAVRAVAMGNGARGDTGPSERRFRSDPVRRGCRLRGCRLLRPRASRDEHDAGRHLDSERPHGNPRDLHLQRTGRPQQLTRQSGRRGVRRRYWRDRRDRRDCPAAPGWRACTPNHATRDRRRPYAHEGTRCWRLRANLATVTPTAGRDSSLAATTADAPAGSPATAIGRPSFAAATRATASGEHHTARASQTPPTRVPADTGAAGRSSFRRCLPHWTSAALTRTASAGPRPLASAARVTSSRGRPGAGNRGGGRAAHEGSRHALAAHARFGHVLLQLRARRCADAALLHRVWHPSAGGRLASGGARPEVTGVGKPHIYDASLGPLRVEMRGCYCHWAIPKRAWERPICAAWSPAACSAAS